MNPNENRSPVALVTGAGRGLGAEICVGLAKAGWTLAVVDLERQRAADCAQRLSDSGATAQAFTANIGNADAVPSLIDNVVECFGGLDGLVNNAGTDTTASVDELSVADWQRVLNTNLSGPFLMAKFALPHLRQRQGYLINIVSTAARRAWPNASAYHASKWGLLGLSHALHAELRGDGIKVTAVIAGGMKTGFLLERFPDLDPNLLQSPEAVARAVVFAMSQPGESVIPEIMVLPMRETSWP